LSHGRSDGEILTEVKEKGEYVSFNTVEVLNSLKESVKDVLKDTLTIVFFGVMTFFNVKSKNDNKYQISHRLAEDQTQNR